MSHIKIFLTFSLNISYDQSLMKSGLGVNYAASIKRVHFTDFIILQLSKKSNKNQLQSFPPDLSTRLMFKKPCGSINFFRALIW